MSAPRYDNPQALRQALADRLRPLSETSGMELSALLRQFAYDRLLCRVFSTDPERWVLMTGAAEELPPLIPIELPGVRHVTYRVYPIADHIADKVCAMFERHPRADGRTEQSTRYRDLVDLVTFAHTATVGASELRRAIHSEAKRRHLTLPGRLEVPSSSGWAAGYARIAGDTPALAERDLTSALSSAGRLVDPVLAGTADGCWDPAAMVWARRESDREAGGP
jgi:hypothetical protein